MNRYCYSGPVMEFNRCVQNEWYGETLAVSAKKAKSNLTYQWKMLNNRLAGTNVTLPGKVELVEEL